MDKAWEIRGDKIVSVTYYGNDGCGSDETEVEICTIQDKDYARRIVACVNACAGISTERLEESTTDPVAGLFGRMAARFEIENRAITSQRDELLAALKEFYKHYVSTLESGRDRIVMLGGDCDPVDMMEAGDPILIKIRDLFKKYDHA